MGVVLHAQVLVARHKNVGAAHLHLHPQPPEDQAGHPQMLRHRVADQQFAAGDGGQADEAAHFHVVRHDPVAAAVRRGTPWMVSVLLPMPLICAPSALRKWARSCTCGSEAALQDRGRALGGDGGQQGLLGAGHAGLVQEHLGAVQPPGAHLIAGMLRPSIVGPQRAQGQQVGIVAPPPDLVAARQAQRRPGRCGPAAARPARARCGCGGIAPGRASPAATSRAQIVTS